MAKKKKVVKKQAKQQSTRSPEQRWTKKLMKDGYTPISNSFLEQYHCLKPEITHGEAMFIIHLLYYKWDDEMPYPGFKTLAKRMLIKDPQARNLARSLETKKYLRRHMRVGQTNRFDLMPLFLALEKLYDRKMAESGNVSKS